MIMTHARTLSSPHTSVNLPRALLSSQCAYHHRRRGRFRPVCAASPTYNARRFMLSAFYLSPHCMSCAPNGTTTRFCIYIQPFVIVCKAVAARTCHARFCRIGRNDGGLLSAVVLTARHSENAWRFWRESA